MSDPFDSRGRYVDDDGNELNPDLIPKPSLCLACAKDDNGDPEEEVLCNLNRLDQQDEPEFRCYAYAAQERQLKDSQESTDASRSIPALGGLSRQAAT